MLVWLSLLWALLPATMKAQTSSVLTMPREVSLQTVTYEPADSMFIEQLLADTTCNSPLDFARRFIGRPYVAATLEVNDREQLVVNTRQLDCTTYVETVTALSLCMKRKHYTFEDYGLYVMLRTVESSESLIRYLHPALPKLSEYDRENGSDLELTLYTYLKCACNTTETADRLFLHRNSVIYRLRRIEELCGIDLDDTDLRFRLRLSFAILNVLNGKRKWADADSGKVH